ncbi:MAG: Late competence protein ComEC, DNA transport [Candidatus Ozemobacter sibiricus]|uniref:Late competence protein ComEC, DNA transport n=1 Tax=Candidatus Ozemobacter sibiricus TaxID=2268124 RepID=A0A367ZR40_9BACT|nr:MAG: Late competence protein ComEC, DNA transport [Candidatus Ozemobacter sibiricus]
MFRTFRLTARSGRFAILSEDPTGAWWYRFALHLRTRFLQVIKQTMPYPESAFLGGVLLGLRGGLPPIVATEFRKTGVSHVLAVSGLHVTIIAGLFYGLFTLFRVPLRVFAPLIVFFLFTFALIVGWPSSAVRAALMNSLFILSRAYLHDRGFRLSIVFSLAVAAAYILSMSPLQLTEPSFVLSFMAIYALAMFTDPAEKLMRDTLRGDGLVLAAVATFLFFLTVTVKRDLVIHPWFFTGTALYIALVVWGSRRLAASSTFQSYSFEMLPGWLKSFTASQVAIFLAMMGPLSAYYFGSMSLAAPLANMIAIPLIGLIVQLGLIAAIIGAFLPVVGVPLALVINAANWLGVKFFLGMAHFFAVLIPFPRVSQPGLGLILGYYALLHLYFYWEPIRDYALALGAAILDLWEDPDYQLPLGLLGGTVLGVVFFLGGFAWSRLERTPTLRVTQLDVGFGSSLLVEKGGRIALIDAGMRDGLSEYDVGERVIQPALSEKFADRLDLVILSSALPERISGLLSVAENYQIGRLLAPFDIPTDGQLIPFQEFVKRFNFADVKLEADFRQGIIPAMPPNYYLDQAFQAFNGLIRRVHKSGIPVGRLAAGTPVPGFEETIEVLSPTRSGDRFAVYYDGAILQIREGAHRLVYSPGSMYALPKVLPERVDVLFLADLPFPLEDFWGLVATDRVNRIALSFRRPSSWLFEGYYMKKIVEGRSIQVERKLRDQPDRFFLTQSDGAIQADVVKDRLIVRPFLEREGKSAAP